MTNVINLPTARYTGTFSQFAREKLGAKWYVAKRDRKYARGQRVTPKQFDALRAEYDLIAS